MCQLRPRDHPELPRPRPSGLSCGVSGLSRLKLSTTDRHLLYEWPPSVTAQFAIFVSYICVQDGPKFRAHFAQPASAQISENIARNSGTGQECSEWLAARNAFQERSEWPRPGVTQDVTGYSVNGKINIVTMADAQSGHPTRRRCTADHLPSGFQAVTMAPSADSLDPLPFGQ